jgi:hypothetical protein
MRTAFFILFSLVALWHLVCSLFVSYLALWPNNEKLWVFVPIAFIPLYVMISYARSRRWSGTHRALSVVAIVPAIWIATEEFFRPYTPNRSWLMPVLLVYLVALVGALAIKSQKEAQQAAP